jgi:hypothetical protein
MVQTIFAQNAIGRNHLPYSRKKRTETEAVPVLQLLSITTYLGLLLVSQAASRSICRQLDNWQAIHSEF